MTLEEVLNAATVLLLSKPSRYAEPERTVIASRTSQIIRLSIHDAKELQDYR